MQIHINPPVDSSEENVLAAIKSAQAKVVSVIRCKVCEDELNRKIKKIDPSWNEHLHVVSKSVLADVEYVFETDTDQELPEEIEKARTEAETRINQLLSHELGVDDCSCIYIICDEVMQEMGMYW